MSRESNLRISFPVADSEKELVNQVCGYLKENFSIDEVSCDENGIFINVWNSEHYYLADVMPLITRIIATIFPDRDIAAEGTGTYSVVDDIHEYSASYNHESKLIFCSRHNYCRGLNEDYGTKYCVLGAGLPASEAKEIKGSAKKLGYTQLVDILDIRTSDPALQTSLSNATWVDYDQDALVTFLRSRKDLCIPNELDKVYGFEDCSRIETVTFGDAVTSIWDNAFRNCKSLREVTIPSTIKELGNGVFANCAALEKVEIACDLDTLPPKLFLNCESLREVTITGKVKSISKTFQGLKKLESVILPEGLEKLGSEAFAGCTSLEKINLPSTLKAIADNAFNGCTKLKLEIPAAVQTVSPFEVQDDLLIKAITCIQNEDEAKAFAQFLSLDSGLNSCKKYKTLEKKYEAEPWYIEYKKQMDKLRAEKIYALSATEAVKKQYLKMTLDEYMLPFYQLLVGKNDYDQAKRVVEENFNEKEIQKINKALTAYYMLEAGYKSKDVGSLLGIPSSLLSKIAMHLEYGKKEKTVMERLRDI